MTETNNTGGKEGTTIYNYGHGFEPRFKLEEARFFLNRMEHSLQNQKDKNSITNFLYFLDAFLSAARSITWVFLRSSKMTKE